MSVSLEDILRRSAASAGRVTEEEESRSESMSMNVEDTPGESVGACFPEESPAPPERAAVPDTTLTPAELEEWHRRTAPDRLQEEALPDPVWRLANLYRCLTEDGRDVPFIPTPEQRAVIWCLHARGWRRLIIPKARQLGMSLLLSLVSLDGVCWREGFHAALIDKKEADAEKKLREKVKFAWDRLPPYAHKILDLPRFTNDQLLVTERTRRDAPESSFSAGINFRGGTVELLWISEWGAIQDTDRARSREIKAGALPAVERAAEGVCVIETTWKGGLDGELGPYIHEAMKTPEAEKGDKSWRILFFGWHTCAQYRQSHGYIDPESARYFAEIERGGVRLDPEQKLWYAEKRRTGTSAKTVKEEYPTLVHECWENSPPGSIYGPAIATARTSGRVRLFETDRWPVHTFWDLGLPVNTVTWYAQIRPESILLVDVDLELDIDLQDRAALMRAKGWNYGCHYLPWEAGQRSSLGTTPAAEYAKVLGHNVRVVPRAGRVLDGIQQLQTLFPRLVFHAGRCARALEHLARYRSERETATGIARDLPVHDRHSHAADALRQLAQALNAGMIEGGNTVGSHGTAMHTPVRVMSGLRR